MQLQAAGRAREPASLVCHYRQVTGRRAGGVTGITEEAISRASVTSVEIVTWNCSRQVVLLCNVGEIPGVLGFLFLISHV